MYPLVSQYTRCRTWLRSTYCSSSRSWWPGGCSNRFDGTCTLESTRRIWSWHCIWQQPKIRRPPWIRRSPRCLLCMQGGSETKNAWSTCWRLQGCERQASLSLGSANSRTTYPSWEGDQQHLHCSGSACQYVCHVCSLPWTRGTSTGRSESFDDGN